MQEILRIWRSSLLDPITLVIVGVMTTIATISGPFGTLEALTVLPRLFFWGVVIGLAATFGILLRVSARLYFPEEQKFKAEVVTTVAFTSLFGAILICWVSFFANIHHVNQYVPPWWKLIGYVSLITIALLALRTFVITMVNERAQAKSEETLQAVISEAQARVQNIEDTKPAEARLLQRLPEEERAPVLCLRSNDHMIDVYTEKGCFSLRMRLKDAIAEMEGVDGKCVHRSHWVARSAIVSAQKVGGYWRLHLSNGMEVPVSRKYQPDLENAGLLVQLAAE